MPLGNGINYQHRMEEKVMGLSTGLVCSRFIKIREP